MIRFVRFLSFMLTGHLGGKDSNDIAVCFKWCSGICYHKEGKLYQSENTLHPWEIIVHNFMTNLFMSVWMHKLKTYYKDINIIVVWTWWCNSQKSIKRFWCFVITKAPFTYVVGFNCPWNRAKLSLKALSDIWKSLIFLLQSHKISCHVVMQPSGRM